METAISTKKNFDANRDILKNPDAIQIGQKLHIP